MKGKPLHIPGSGPQWSRVGSRLANESRFDGRVHETASRRGTQRDLRPTPRQHRRIAPAKVAVTRLAPVPRRALKGRGRDVVDPSARRRRRHGVGDGEVVADVRRGGGVGAL